MSSANSPHFVLAVIKVTNIMISCVSSSSSSSSSSKYYDCDLAVAHPEEREQHDVLGLRERDFTVEIKGLCECMRVYIYIYIYRERERYITIDVYMYIYIYICILCIYIYIYIERERYKVENTGWNKMKVFEVEIQGCSLPRCAQPPRAGFQR